MEESRRLNNMYIEKNPRAAIAAEYFAKSSAAVMLARDGQRSCGVVQRRVTEGVASVQRERVVLLLRGQD